LTIERGVYRQVVGDVKTENSAASRPLVDEIVEVLNRWRQASDFSEPEDWVFASSSTLGRQPLSYPAIWKKLAEVSEKAGIGHISPHCFRHTYRTWLDSVGAPVGVQQKMMRHSDIRTTMNVYGDALTDDMREANMKVSKLVFPQ
jgi:integrase